MGFSIGKVFKPVGKIVNTVADVASDVISAPVQVVDDLYSGTKKTVGSVGRGVEKVGSGLTSVASNEAFIAGTLASGSPEGGANAFLQQQAFQNQLDLLSRGFTNPLNLDRYRANTSIPGNPFPTLALGNQGRDPEGNGMKVGRGLTTVLLVGGAAVILIGAIFLFRGKK